MIRVSFVRDQKHTFHFLSSFLINAVPKLNIGILSIAIFIIHSSYAANQDKQEIWPAHYTETHRVLHRRLRDTTHSHLQHFEIIVPAKTDRQYRHLSYNLGHNRPNRIRRDVVEPITPDEETRLFYSFSGFGQDFRFRLDSNNQLLAPTFSVTRIKRETKKEEFVELNNATGCHYHGRLLSHGGAPIAVSTCNGLTGLLRTEEDDYFIEPVPEHLNHSFDPAVQPHLIYSRSYLDKGKHRLHYCGKKRHYPVQIPLKPEEQTMNFLSNGEIELEKTNSSSFLIRKKRTVEILRRFGTGTSESELEDQMTRSFERPRVKNIETLVVVDRDMIRNHEHDQQDITTYILTIMNIVSALFSDRSLQGQIKLVLVGIVLLEDNHDLHLDHKADESLANFCKWQYSLNRNRSKPADHSILLTGIDICVHKNSPCATLGLAQIGGMCNSRHSCTINEDIGLGLAFTVAHETGHSFGMRHDGQGNICSKLDGHIMSPTLNGLNGVFTWSTCSRKALQEFLSDDRSACLDNHPIPVAELAFPKQLPGEIYDALEQCRWQFGANSHLCDFRYKHKKSSLCKILWCQKERSRVCETKYMPAAEGTSCGNNMWCRRGMCVPYGEEGPEPIDGVWGTYGPWSVCSRTCGGGVRFRLRACNNPSPKYGGQYCQGKEKIYQLCNIQTCPPSQLTFREEQCASFNSKPYRRQYFNWVPFTKYSRFGRGRCELLCKAENYDFFDMLADRVADGTPCDQSSNDVCIEGKCEHVGCDYVLGSNATFDECGVCDGDNSTCDRITGAYNDEVQDSGYYEVVRIPRGARSVRIREEQCCTHSYIAIKSGFQSQKYYLNGDWQVDLYGTISFAGVKWKYERKSYEAENLFTPGPIIEDIIIEVLIIASNPGITYSYTVPKLNNYLPRLRFLTTLPTVVYEWSLTFSECSSSCGGGAQASIISCHQNQVETVDEGKCSTVNKPSMTTRACNVQTCPARWETTSWSECSATCGTGSQVRQVSCKALTSEGDTSVSDSKCQSSIRPEQKQKCELKHCLPEWQAGEWSKCSRKCGRGTKTRLVFCRSGLHKVRKTLCNHSSKPNSHERCMVTYCKRVYQWFIKAWDECSATCGEGVQIRQLHCSYKKRNGQFRLVGYRRCQGIEQPQVALKQKCVASISCAETTTTSLSTNRFTKASNTGPNLKYVKWVVGSWQKCSVTCGGGIQMRLVKCLHGGQETTPLACSQHRKPLDKRSCNTYKCSFSASNENPTNCQDSFSWCYLVPQHGQCHHKYFGEQCCKTCFSSK